MDTTLIGVTTAQLMDVLERDYEGDETAVVTEVIVCCIINTHRDQQGNNNDRGFSNTQYRASDPVVQHQVGLLTSCLAVAKRGF